MNKTWMAALQLALLAGCGGGDAQGASPANVDIQPCAAAPALIHADRPALVAVKAVKWPQAASHLPSTAEECMDAWQGLLHGDPPGSPSLSVHVDLVDH